MSLAIGGPAPLQMLPSQPALAAVGNIKDDSDGKLSKKQMSTIDAASHQFESVFMGEMLKPMFQTVKTDSMFGGGEAEGTYRNLLIQQMGKEVANNGGLGLAKYVKAEMIKLQEGANKS